MAKATQGSDRIETIAEECHCFKCGKRWKVILDGKMGKIPEKYLPEYEAHIYECVTKPKEEAERRKKAILEQKERGFKKEEGKK